MTRRTFVVSPANQTRTERRAMQREVAARMRDGQPARSSKKDRALPEPAVPGPFGPGLTEGGYWNLSRPALPPHQATSQHLAGIYPFVADAGLGHRGPIVGVDLNADALWHFSPWDAYADPTDRGSFSTNVLVLGSYRSGKSSTIKTLVTRSIPFGHNAVVPSDPKGEWVVVAESVGGTVIRLGGPTGARLNPLDRGPRRTGASDEQHEQMVRQRRIATLISLVEMAVGGVKLTAVEHACIHLALERAIGETSDEPTLREVYRQLARISTGELADEPEVSAAASQPRFVLRRFVEGDLSGLFEDASTVQFDDNSPLVVVDTSELFSRGDLVAQLTQVCTTSWVQAVISDRNAKRTRYVVREEGWRDMTSLAALQMYQQWLKLSRHYGISNIVILHKMGDLDAVGDADSQERNLAYSIVGDIENKLIFRVNHQEHASLRDRLHMPTAHVDMARQLRKGEFLAYVGQYSYLVDCFATSTQWEYDLFMTDDAMQPAPEVVASLEPTPLVVDDVWPNDVWPSEHDTDLAGWLTSEKETR
ncbi:hypothetical protein M4I32_12430 [Microbacterium sp. LRZ72]|uniref:hypothetical protein n=1 Tax=Microbacterium sp. LRZ72 TaxID=2942481 RepID=UPI0029AD87A6|nr:hypothetical protein [Microbacterium sp. LRZ72]MDX2377607.1 hypothetical protein [Microbacterium sp. LRZ72]